jgi:hypothetical protein
VTAKAFPTVRSRGSRSRTCSSSTGSSCCCAPTTSGRSSTTARAGSAPTRSSGVTRQCRSARATPWSARTGSSRATASPRSAAARDAGRDGPVLVARPPRRLVEPGRLERRLDLRPIATHVPHAAGLAWGKKLRGKTHVRDRLLRRRRDLGGRVPRGRQLRRRDARAARLFCNNNQWAISTPLSAQTAPRRSPDKAVGYGNPGLCAWTAATCSPSTRRRARRSRGRARARGRR